MEKNQNRVYEEMKQQVGRTCHSVSIQHGCYFVMAIALHSAAGLPGQTHGADMIHLCVKIPYTECAQVAGVVSVMLLWLCPYETFRRSVFCIAIFPVPQVTELCSLQVRIDHCVCCRRGLNC